MHDFTNPSKRLRAQFSLFMERFVYPHLTKPQRKLAFDMTWGIIASGSVKLTEICRCSSPGQRLKTAECRVSEALSRLDAGPLWEKLASGLFAEFGIGEARFDIDESDIAKPRGRAFANLCKVHDGSDPGKAIVKGYPVTGLVALLPSGQPLPVMMNVYSYAAEGFSSVAEETRSAMSMAKRLSPAGRLFIMDRWYDSSALMEEASDVGSGYVIRGKSSRKYKTPSGKSAMTGSEIAKFYKGRFVSRFADSDGRMREQRFSSVRVRNRGLPGGEAWLVFEWLDGESEPRWYITSVDASTKAACAAVIALYRKRWMVEETFRFLKQLFGLEGFMALGYASIRAIAFFAAVAMDFLIWVIERRTALYSDAMEAHQDVRDAFAENGILKDFGSGFLKVYRVCRGMAKIAQHVANPPRPLPERRPRKGDCVQLKLKLNF